METTPGPRRLIKWLVALVASCLLAGAVARGQERPPDPLPPVKLDPAETLHHLNQVILWYRHGTTGIPVIGLLGDAIYPDKARDLGAQAVQLAFQAAQAESKLIAAEQKANTGAAAAGPPTQQQKRAAMLAQTTALIGQLKTRIDQLDGQMAKAPAARRASLAAQRDDLQGQMDLQKALLEASENMAAFEESNSELSDGLEGGINQLARSIPEVLSGANPPKGAGALAADKTAPASGGLISEAVTLYDYMVAVHQISGFVKETSLAIEVADHLRTPLRDAMRATIQQSQTQAGQPPSTDAQQAQPEREVYGELTERFKQLSGALLPLSKELIVLNDSKANADQWRSAIAHESRHVMRSVLLRMAGILIALTVILVLSELWRRITFRYVVEPRRRRQFLMMRRVVIGFLVVVVLILGFVSQFSSLATFAGFITAGIAVGLQAVLLSVAAYFFIIGRYGIRVGDRISIAGITGDVVDIGLVRLYLMELAGTGLDLFPTGRIVVFSNAVLFQAATPLFKQIPGTEYAWHEVVVMIAPGANHKQAQDKLVAAVDAVYADYQPEIEQQHATVERHTDIQIQAPRPAARIQFTDAGLELLVRYPVMIRKAPEVDELMTRSILALIETDPDLKAAVAGNPGIRSAVKG
jgi:small-conductance mechanosensitive channel